VDHPVCSSILLALEILFSEGPIDIAIMSGLRFLVLSLSWSFYSGDEDLPWVVHSLERMSGKNNLEGLSLVLLPDTTDLDVSEDFSSCVMKLDLMLSGSGFPALRKVDLFLHHSFHHYSPDCPPTTPDSDSSSFEQFLAYQLNRLHSKGILKIQYLQNDIYGLCEEVSARASESRARRGAAVSQ
jgi:hypothetical protein